MRSSDLPTDVAARGRALLETHHELIQQQLRRLSWHSGLPDSEKEDFRSWAVVKLVDNDYRILGSWEGRSSFPTFLAVVLMNLMRDYRTHVWGKWRPSAASRRWGRAGMLLETFIVRDRLSDEEALAKLRTVHGIDFPWEELAKLKAALPLPRPDRRPAGEEGLVDIPVDGDVERRVEEEEQARITDRLRELLVPLLQSLPAEDRLLLKLHFFDSLSMAAISRIQRRPQRELYSARDRCLKKLRRSLKKAGVSSEEIRELLGRLQESLGLETPLGDP